jgi:hypothetical protein
MSEAGKPIEPKVKSTERDEAADDQLNADDLESVVGGLGIPPLQNAGTNLQGSGLGIGGTASQAHGVSASTNPSADDLQNPIQ